MIYQIAGEVGVLPDTLTLRELLQMAEGRRRQAWNHTAGLMALIANCHRNPKTRAFGVDDFHPMMKRRKKKGLPMHAGMIEGLANAMGAQRVKSDALTLPIEHTESPEPQTECRPLG